MVERNQELFATAEVARLLGQPEWRVIKFVEGEQYGIKPAAVVGSGTGGRRLYDVENVCEFAVALRLLESGLRSLDIGRVIRQLREKGPLQQQLSDNRELYIAIARKPRSGTFLATPRPQEVSFVRGSKGAGEILRRRKDYALILVPMGSVFRKVQRELSELHSKSSRPDVGE